MTAFNLEEFKKKLKEWEKLPDYGVIYLIRNKITEEGYVGQTARNFDQRFSEHLRASSVFGKALRKYGANNFEYMFFRGCKTKEELANKEKELINHLETLTPNGYNQCLGGGTNVGYKHKEESKIKMSIAKKGKTLINSGSFKRRFRVKAIHTKTEEILYFESTVEAGKNGFNKGHVAACCRKEEKQHKKYKWEYINE